MPLVRALLLASVLALLLAITSSASSDPACTQLHRRPEVLKTNSSGAGAPLLIGAVGSHLPGGEAAWNETFDIYLTEKVAGASFVLIPFDSAAELLAAAAAGCLDFAFGDAVIATCLQLKTPALPLASAVSYVNGEPVEWRRGAIVTRSSSSSSGRQSSSRAWAADELAGATVGAQSIWSVDGFLLQMAELRRQGVEIWTDIAQVSFLGGEAAGVVKAVLEGTVDVGFVPAGTVEALVREGDIEAAEVHVIPLREEEGGGMDDAPFAFSTRFVAPSWTLSALSNVSQEVAPEVSRALTEKQAEADDTLENDGHVAFWVSPPPSLLGTYELLREGGRIRLDSSRNSSGLQKCTSMQNSASVLDAIVCPEGAVKVSADEFSSEGCHGPSESSPCVISQPCKFIDIAYSHPQYIVTLDSVTGAAGPSTLSEQVCANLELCARVSQFDVLHFYMRTPHRTGVSPLEDTEFRWWGGNQLNAQWEQPQTEVCRPRRASDVETEESEAYCVSFAIHANGTGTHLLEIRHTSGSDLSAGGAISSYRIQVMPVKCALAYTVPDESGACVCVPGYSVHEGGTACVNDASGMRLHLDVIIPLAVVVCILAAALVVAIVLLLGQRKSAPVHPLPFVIKSDEIAYPNREIEVLGISSSGPVLMALYCGTPVALKPMIPTWKTVHSLAAHRLTADSADEQDDQRGISSFNPSVLRGENSGHNLMQSLMTEQGRIVLTAESKRQMNSSKRRLSVTRSTIERATSLKDLYGGVTKKKKDKSKPPDFATRADIAFVKRLKAGIESDVRSICGIRHPSIATMMGAVVSEYQLLLVMQYMPYGTLYDVLHSKHFTALDAQLMQKLILSVARGLVFLHNQKPMVLHTNLTSESTMVDDHLSAKLGKFGMRAKFSMRSLTVFDAPEVLRGEPHTVASDVYSLGMLMYEVFTRMFPFRPQPAKAVLKLVKDATRSEPYRPRLPSELPATCKALLMRCWAEDPAVRPTCAEVCATIEGLDLTELNSYIDSNLTSTRRDTKFNLTQDQVLRKVFPTHIATALQRKQKVEPESYDCVTVFFSDIVGYTDISKKYDAIVVMDFLDRLFSKFDQLIKKYGLFKVETVGDAYMAVGNLTEEYSDHAARVARFSLEAVQAANDTPILPADRSAGCIDIRAGFHSGPVVASVVGTVNPRYCLFGDTVNTASRMESNSEINRLHCSAASAVLIEKTASKEFSESGSLELRGDIPIKGKGRMTTYWVNPKCNPAEESIATTPRVPESP